MLLWPCFLGLAISNGNLWDYLIFFIGTLAMRSAGCIINDIADQDFDRQVNRTKTRPLASKQLTTSQALMATIFFLCISLVAWFFLNTNAKYISLIGALLMVIYPFTKRFTSWPQLFLGITFNFGLIVAVTHSGTLTLSILILFLSLVGWTIFYDTIYAFADIKDDLKIGIKSTAIVMQQFPKTYLTICNVLIHIILLTFLRTEGLICIIPITAGFFYLQTLLFKWKIENPQCCTETFSKCHFWGLGLWLWIVLTL